MFILSMNLGHVVGIAADADAVIGLQGLGENKIQTVDEFVQKVLFRQQAVFIIGDEKCQCVRNKNKAGLQEFKRSFIVSINLEILRS